MRHIRIMGRVLRDLTIFTPIVFEIVYNGFYAQPINGLEAYCLSVAIAGMTLLTQWYRDTARSWHEASKMWEHLYQGQRITRAQWKPFDGPN